jgi:hypothetical protein
MTRHAEIVMIKGFINLTLFGVFFSKKLNQNNLKS